MIYHGVFRMEKAGRAHESEKARVCTASCHSSSSRPSWRIPACDVNWTTLLRPQYREFPSEKSSRSCCSLSYCLFACCVVLCLVLDRRSC